MGPALLLLDRDRVRDRLLLAPVLGLSAAVLAGIVGAAMGWTGRAIAWWTLASIGALSVLALVFRRPRREEVAAYFKLTAAALPILALVTWPLLSGGYDKYYGLANPDMAFYVSWNRFLEQEPLREPNDGELNRYYELDTNKHLSMFGPDTTVTLGTSYLLMLISQLSGVPKEQVFVPLSAAFLFLVPGSVFLLALAGGLSRRASLGVMLLANASSIVAYTFYLNSLGAMSVIASVPAVVVLVALFLGSPGPRLAIACAIAIAGMYFGYFPGFGVLGIAVAGWVLASLVTRRISVWPVAALAGLATAALLVPNPRHGAAIAVRLVNEALSSKRQAVLESELLMAFARTLTEEGVPFVWGLDIPNINYRFLSDFWDFPLLFAAGVVLTFVVLLSISRKYSPLDSGFLASFGALLAVTALYWYGDNAYGVFKIVAWLQPFLLVAVAGGTIAALRLLIRRRWLAWLPLAGWIVTNVALAIHLGKYSLTAGIPFGAFQSLASIQDPSVRAKLDPGPTLLAVSDPWAIRWAVALAPNTHLLSFPFADLFRVDSKPRTLRSLKGAQSVLYVSNGESEVSPPVAPAVWSNSHFALANVRDCTNCLFLGRGWYRPEGARKEGSQSDHKFHWLGRRGELLLLNPSSEPQRLSLSLGAGFGAANESRRIQFYLNGEKIEEFEFSGASRVLTKPFTATGPYSQIEIAILQEALPRARRFPMWKRWVPEEARRLNISLSDVRVVPENSDFGPALHSMLDSSNLVLSSLAGAYADRWIGPAATFALRVPQHVAYVELAGVVPGVPSLRFPYTIKIRADETVLAQCTVPRAGEFSCREKIQAGALDHLRRKVSVRLELLPGATFSTERDPRKLSVRMERLALTADSAPPARLDLSDGELPPESQGVYADRWVGEKASVRLSPPPDTEAVRVEGFVPGNTSLRFPLRLSAFVDQRQVASFEVRGPGDFSLTSPLDVHSRAKLKAVAPVVVELRAASTFQTKEDSRKLSFRMKSIALVGKASPASSN